MGELAAFVTAIFWSFTSIFFSKSSQSLGAMNVNRIRLAMAVAYLMLAHLILEGTLLPLNAGLDRWVWLGLSAIAGLVFGDSCLMQSYVLVGPRLGTLMMATAPVISTILAWTFLGETLSWLELLGILITVAGVSIVVLEKPNGGKHTDRKRYALGILFGLGGAFGQASGLILAKKGLTGDFPSLSGVLVRMLVALTAMWLLALISGKAVSTMRTGIENRRMLIFIALGATFGPFLGVWLSLIAVRATHVGVASTLMALQPILVLPLLWVLYKERVSPLGIGGTIVALGGVALLFLS